MIRPRRTLPLLLALAVTTALAFAGPEAATAGPTAERGSAGATAAAADLSGLMRTEAAPAMRSTPTGAALARQTTLPGLTRLSASSCAADQARLAAKEIASYRCVQIRQLPATAAERVGAGSVSAKIAWPSACSSGTGTLIGWTAVSRRAACTHQRYGITVVEVPSGKVVGTAVLHAVSTMTASTSKASWHSTMYLWLWSATGVGAPESVTGNLFPSCSKGCLGTGGSWSMLSDDASWRGSGNVDSLIGKRAIDRSVSGFWEMNLSRAGWSNSVLLTTNLARSRCDDAIGGRRPGCVFANIPGVVGFSQKAYPAFVSHIYRAQVSGLPGRLSTGTYLTRLESATLRAKNGKKACPSSLSRPKGYQCDEYPFRSTHQGAYTSHATKARSFSGCRMKDPRRTGSTGWSRCFIPTKQNLGAGGVLSAFYGSERILDGDRFQIGYLP